MIYNEKRFSEIAFTKHIAKAEKCSQCSKPVIQVADHVKSNYHEFVFGTDYKELLKKFYSGLEYTNFLFYKNGKIGINSFCLIHNKHDDSFFVTYYNPVKYNKEVIQENNNVLVKVFSEYTHSHRKKIINDIWYYYRDRESKELSQEQANITDKNLQNALTCINHETYEISLTVPDHVKIKKTKINLSKCNSLYEPDIENLLKNKSTQHDVLLPHKKRLRAYIYNSYLKWLSETSDFFPDMLCNVCASKHRLVKIFKSKDNVDEMGSKPDSRVFQYSKIS